MCICGKIGSDKEIVVPKMLGVKLAKLEDDWTGNRPESDLCFLSLTVLGRVLSVFQGCARIPFYANYLSRIS